MPAFRDDMPEMQQFLDAARATIKDGTASPPRYEQFGARTVAFRHDELGLAIVEIDKGELWISSFLPKRKIGPSATGLDTLLAKTREQLELANSYTISSDEQGRAVNAFGSTIAALGRWLVRHPEDSATIGAVVEELGKKIDDRTPLGRWFMTVYRASESHEFRTYELEQAFELRSDLQFFIDLFRGKITHNWVEQDDMDSLDERIRDTADATGPSGLVPTPPDIPPHHVWWTWGFR